MTAKEKAFRDGLWLAELQSGQNLTSVDAKSRKNRRRMNGEIMYKNSASVPDSLVKFAHEIHEEDRITHLEERELGEKTQEALRLQNLYDNLVAQLDREPTDDEWCAAAGKINMQAIQQTIQEGIDAKNKLVTANLRMVQACVNLYIRNGLGGQYNAGDMMQEGIMVCGCCVSGRFCACVVISRKWRCLWIGRIVSQQCGFFYVFLLYSFHRH